MDWAFMKRVQRSMQAKSMLTQSLQALQEHCGESAKSAHSGPTSTALMDGSPSMTGYDAIERLRADIGLNGRWEKASMLTPAYRTSTTKRGMFSQLSNFSSELKGLTVKYFFFLGLFGGVVGPLFGLTPDPVNLLVINAIFIGAGEWYGRVYET